MGQLGQARRGRQLLVTGALSGLNTLNALRPLSQRDIRSIASCVAGAWTAEIPLHALALDAAVAGHLVARGALGTRPGKLGLALTLGSWAGLAQLYHSAQADGDRLEDALLDALGADYHDWLGNSGAAPELPLTGRQIALPGAGARGLRASRGLPYGDGGPDNRLDVWRRADLEPGAGAPVLLQIHGGAWVFGSKDTQARPLLAHLAERGWVCVAINYRLSPKHQWPAHIVDVKQAIAWIRENISSHGGDPGFVAVTGGSAGGHLSALAALSINDPAFQPGFETADTSVQAALPVYGQYDLLNEEGFSRRDTITYLERRVFKRTVDEDRATFLAASPLHRVHPGAPPFFVVHGANDSILPARQARFFAEQLRRVSRNPVAYAELPKAQHAFDLFSSVRSHHFSRAAERFLRYAHTAYQDGAAAARRPGAKRAGQGSLS